MMIPLLAAAALLYTKDTPLKEREQRLAPLFSPRPGEALTVDKRSAIENANRPAFIRGELRVSPPKGQCLIVRMALEKRDQRVCKATTLHWEINDLDAIGKLTIEVLSDNEWDDGVILQWPSPYRLANLVAAGDIDNNIYEDLPIKTCEARESADGERTIRLETFNGRVFRISLPEKDQPVQVTQDPAPNLIVNVDSSKKPEAEKKDAGAHGDKEKAPAESHDAAAPTDQDAAKAKNPTEPDKGSVLGTLLSGEYKLLLKQEVKFRLPKRGAYEMESGLFSEDGAPKGMSGKCRYMFKGAPGDEASGAIECFETDTLDALYITVSCFDQLKERPAPPPPEKKGS